jgi:XTP/dITP diphosphohydrolase
LIAIIEPKSTSPSPPDGALAADPAGSLLLATSNPGKAREYAALLGPVLRRLGLKLLTLADLAASGQSWPEAAEEADSFIGNALAKARHHQARSGLLTLADDSGLCLAALGGAPGVLSARYGGPGLDDRQRAEKLLADLDSLPESRRPEVRRAHFETALALAGAEGIGHLLWTGRLDGAIAREPRGRSGFGYDPIFIPDGFRTTLAQMSPEEKNGLSHRARALTAMTADLGKIERWLGR